MKITISGHLGSGKTTVSKLLAKKLNFKHYSAGDFMRQMAKDRNISLLELSKQAENSIEIDKEIDSYSAKIGKEKDSFVMDTRLGFHFTPDSVKIFFKVDQKEAARRIFNDLRPEEKENVSLEKTEENMGIREQSELTRYQRYYGINLHDTSKHDFIIGTTELTVEQVVNEIISFVKEKL